MTEPLDLEPIKARLAEATDERLRLGPIFVSAYPGGEPWKDARAMRELIQKAPADTAALIAEVERLRREADCWRDATHHLSGKRGEARGQESP